MDYAAFLSKRITKQEAEWLRGELLFSSENFNQVFRLIFQKPDNVAWQAAWVCEKVSELSGDMFTDDERQTLTDFTLSNTHTGLQRLCLSILLNLPVIKPVSVEFINNCFEQMISPKQPVGVQVLSMKMLEKICSVEPDFTSELIASLENFDPSNYSAGFVAARKNVLKKLRKRKKLI